MRFVRDVAAISRKIERRVRFVRLVVAIRQLANKNGARSGVAHASRRFRQTDLDERRIWLVRAYLSSDGNDFVASKFPSRVRTRAYRHSNLSPSQFAYCPLSSVLCSPLSASQRRQLLAVSKDEPRQLGRTPQPRKEPYRV